ncbi:MAG: hypothetical protein IJ740_08480 [Ruminococcus sp.]|nr:hypothetical protein [Ruminococcus sp.]
MRDKAKASQKAKERRAWYLAHGICPHCGQNEPQKGYKLCLECRTANNDRRRANYKPEESQSERHKALRERRIAKGLCPKCGKRKPEIGYKSCSVCKAKSRAAGKRKSRRQGRITTEQRLSGYYCYHCSAELPEWRENKLCDSCLKTARAAAENARRYINRQDHPFGRADRVYYQLRSYRKNEFKEVLRK